MSIAGKDLNTINEQDLQDLIDFGVPESVVLEYKRDDYGRSDEQKKEFLKDVTAFANTEGGHLIIGIEEVTSPEPSGRLTRWWLRLRRNVSRT